MHVVQELLESLREVEISSIWAGIVTTVTFKCIRWAQNFRMTGDYTICMEMCSNGVRIGMTLTTTAKVLQVTLSDRIPGRNGYYGVDVFFIKWKVANPHIVVVILRTSAPPSSASAPAVQHVKHDATLRDQTQEKTVTARSVEYYSESSIPPEGGGIGVRQRCRNCGVLVAEGQQRQEAQRYGYYGPELIEEKRAVRRIGFWERLLGRGGAADSPSRNGLNAAGKACRDAGSEPMGLEADRSGRRAGETMTIALPGGAAMEMVWCPPGSFLMGSPKSEEGRNRDERQHQVTLTKGFWMAKYPVTQAQWQSVMRSNPVVQRRIDIGADWSGWVGETMPVHCVSWEDCQAFCRKTRLRLPTEAEWEYACRAGSTGPYAGTGQLEDMGWFDYGQMWRGGVFWPGQLPPVGLKQPNAWGLYDMHGNVHEWCEDRYGSYPRGPVIDPKGGSFKRFHVYRGGDVGGSADVCRCAWRGHWVSSWWGTVGFRPVRQDTTGA